MTAISLIRSSWEFFRKQPALTMVGVWLLFLPMLASDILSWLVEGENRIPVDFRAEGTIGIVILLLLLTVISVWGHCAVLVTGRRMLQTKAGRSRTSFRTTASQSKAFVIPFLLTNLLRGCIALLWMLPLSVLCVLPFLVMDIDFPTEPAMYVPAIVLLALPGVIYLIRTLFAPVIVVGENIAYRAALRRAKEAMKGNFWKITGQLLLIIFLLFVIPMVIISLAALSLPQGTPVAYAVESIVTNAWIAVGTILLTLCLIQMYEKVRAPKQR